jgi:hypothetical protein
MSEALKLSFINKALVEFNERTIAQMRADAARQKISVTGDGLKSLAYKVYEQTSGGSSTLSFHEYLRMVDMGAGRGHPLGGLRSTLVSLQSQNKVGFAQVKDNVRKPKKFYSKKAYGNLSGLYNRLLYGYTEEVIAQLKQELNNEQKTD